MTRKKGDLVAPAVELGKPVLTEISGDEIDAALAEIEAEGEPAVDPRDLLRDALDALARVEFKTDRGGVFHLVLHSPDGGTVPFSCNHGGRADLTGRMAAWSKIHADALARIDAAL